MRLHDRLVYGGRKRRFITLSGPPAGRGGFTLIEVIVAAVLLMIIAFSILASITYASQIARVNTYAITAKNIAQGYLERMQIDNFDDVGPTNYPDVATNSDPPVWLDQALGITCSVQFVFDGFGTVNNCSGNNLTVEEKPGWPKDKWAGNTVFITSGPGAGQYSLIDASTPNTLHLADKLEPAPGKGATYAINNGKNVKVTVSYLYRGKTYSQTIESLIINRRN